MHSGTLEFIKAYLDRLTLTFLVILFAIFSAFGGQWAANPLIATLSALIALMTGRTGKRSTDTEEK